ncbi:Clc chloride channel [Bimuria novae-zelandiae CBS 107.79]|uniref:Chloride channel protein n=1 Tax=Bimuria novae-zelandiae CBS 107.79 TaxID=1447943 RepID=A0A6A5UT73_9PLEO|nr:Clc chloride channel [Bimuria novae-zelandiae CBS 107.79]
MSISEHEATERTALLYHVANDRRLSELEHEHDAEAQSIISSTVTKEEQALGTNAVGERLPYNDYTTIDGFMILGLRNQAISLFEASSGWIAVMFIGAITACVAFVVDVAVATVSDWKSGQLPQILRHPRRHGPRLRHAQLLSNHAHKVHLPHRDPDTPSKDAPPKHPAEKGKVMYMASGSGIPEIKTLLSGFVSTCVGALVGNVFPKYRSNGRKMRELLSAACASGLSVAFGAPIGGVLFSYEISTYFPRTVLWRAFLCSMVAAMVLKELNPMGTGKLVLFETNYGSDYRAVHYVVFVVLGLAGGVFGGLFCKMNFLWAKCFRSFGVIKRHPVLEVALVVLATALLQFPNPLTREPGDVIIKNLLVECGKGSAARPSWVCQNEASGEVSWGYTGTLFPPAHGVPSGIIIPALDAGAFFDRLLSLFIPSISPGIFALVGAAAFLAGVSRMTISLAVTMFELTSSFPYTLPCMLAILVAKCTADAISPPRCLRPRANPSRAPLPRRRHSLKAIRGRALLVEELIPPPRTMAEITVSLGPGETRVRMAVLLEKLALLKGRGLMDAGLVVAELEFALTKLLPEDAGAEAWTVRVLEHGDKVEEDGEGAPPEALEADLTPFVDRTPLSICARAPLEYAVEMFSKLGLKYLCVTEEGTGSLVGVIIKKRLVGYLEQLKEGGHDD